MAKVRTLEGKVIAKNRTFEAVAKAEIVVFEMPRGRGQASRTSSLALAACLIGSLLSTESIRYAVFIPDITALCCTNLRIT
jgi:hypothetical protein